ncbi:MAG: RHS repeat protein [Gammaproteobacteria bacterium]|nr:RHS repeat protein [Gammaproteobacteria bacterium]
MLFKTINLMAAVFLFVFFLNTNATAAWTEFYAVYSSRAQALAACQAQQASVYYVLYNCRQQDFGGTPNWQNAALELFWANSPDECRSAGQNCNHKSFLYDPNNTNPDLYCHLSGTYPSNFSVSCTTSGASTDKNLAASAQCVGNPCNPATGNKYQIETDIPPTGAVPALVRYYNSQLPKDFNTGFGWSWDSINHLENITDTSLLARRPNGQGFFFQKIFNAWQSDADIGIGLTQDASGYALQLRDGSIEHYSTGGILVSMTTPQGLTTTVTSGGGTSIVAGPFGHALTSVIGANNDIATITTPANEVTHYSYDANNNLIKVTYPDNTARVYYYEDANNPHGLTGIAYVDASNNTTRYSAYAYNTTGKATLTQHAQTDNGAPQEKFTLAYDVPTANQTTVTDSVGMNEVMTFVTNLGVKNLTSKVNQSDSKSVQQVFDANNNLTCRKDEENRVTLYGYNGTNQKISMTEGLGGSDCNTCLANPANCNAGGVGRVTTYDYLSPALDLVHFIRRPSVASGQTFETEMQYGDTTHPNLPTSIIQRGYTPVGASVSRTVTLGYNTYGQVSSINGPRTDVNDVTTLEYYDCTTGGACGQLKKVTNALGHITTYDLYDANGRLLQMTDSNGW